MESDRPIVNSVVAVKKAIVVIVIFFLLLCTVVSTVYFTKTKDNAAKAVALACVIGMAVTVIYDKKVIGKNKVNVKSAFFSQMKERLMIEYEPNAFSFEDKDDYAYTKKDMELFALYDEAIERDLENFKENYISVIDVERYKKIDSRTLNKKDVFLYSYNEVVNDDEMIHLYTMVLATEVETRKRLYLNVKNKTFYKINNVFFEDVFDDYKEIVNKMDSKFAEKYTDKYLLKYHDELFQNPGKYEYLEIGDYIKDALIKIFKETGIHFGVALENGVIRVQVNLINVNDALDRHTEYVEKITKIYTEVLKIFETID